MWKDVERWINRVAGWPQDIDEQTVVDEKRYASLLTTAAAQNSGPLTLLPRFEEVAAIVGGKAPNLAAAIRVEAVNVITDFLVPTAAGGLSSDRAAETHAKITEWLGNYPETDLPGALEARILLKILAKLTKPTL